jgi:hypothetical protein
MHDTVLRRIGAIAHARIGPAVGGGGPAVSPLIYSRPGPRPGFLFPAPGHIWGEGEESHDLSQKTLPETPPPVKTTFGAAGGFLFRYITSD